MRKVYGVLLLPCNRLVLFLTKRGAETCMDLINWHLQAGTKWCRVGGKVMQLSPDKVSSAKLITFIQTEVD